MKYGGRIYNIPLRNLLLGNYRVTITDVKIDIIIISTTTATDNYYDKDRY